MLGRIAVAAIVAGAVAGVFFWAAHMIKVMPLVIQAEVYEEQSAGGGHAHNHASDQASDRATGQAAGKAVQAEEEWTPASSIERAAYTLIADLLLSIGFAFVLCGAFAISGRAIDWREGTVWGIVAFAAVYVSPVLGLAPELPGMQASDLHARQAWWLSAAVAGAVGLALAFLARPIWLRVGGAVLVVVPHLIGAPVHELHAGPVPAELAAQFAVASLAVTGFFWVVLGACAGYAFERMQKT
jgi:cobalt transporter subunit CbtA